MQDAPYQVKKPLWLKLIVWLVVLVLGYVAFAYAIPYMHAYDVKTALKTACVEYVRETRNTEYREENATWPENFRTAMTRLKVELTPEQYSFKLQNELNEVICTGKAAYVSFTEWPGSFLFTGKTRKFRTVHRPEHVYKWRRSY